MFAPNRFVYAEPQDIHVSGNTRGATTTKQTFKGVLRFGKFKDRYVDDLLEVEKRYIEKFILEDIDDLPADVRAYFELALELEGDPLRLDPNRAPPAITRDKGAQKVGALKAKLKAKVKEKKNAEEAKKDAVVLDKRKEEAEW